MTCRLGNLFKNVAKFQVFNQLILKLFENILRLIRIAKAKQSLLHNDSLNLILACF